ncbi:MAG: cyclic nucleotide-binding domain-containing protein [Nodosilinea sp.]
MSTLLRELHREDVSWLRQTGNIQTAEANTILVSPNCAADCLYVVLDGQLTVLMQSQGGAKELLRLTTGDLAGALPVEGYLPQATVGALTDSKVLAVPAAAIAQKLQSDAEFAARLYRVVALLLRQQLTQWAAQLGYSLGLLSQLQLKEASTVFAELMDSDLDWLAAVGQVEAVKPGTVVLSCGQPVDALHVLLEGAVGLQATETPTPLVAQAFAPDPERSEQEFARLSRGDLIGETALLDPAPASFSAIALRESQLLTIPHWRLTARLLYAPDFAARLYRLLAILLANKQRVMLQKLDLLTADAELDSQFVERMALAEARFDWLVKRLHTQQPGDAQW